MLTLSTEDSGWLQLLRMKHLSFKGILIGCFLTLALFGVNKVRAEDSPEQAQRIRALVDELRCPTCQGLSVKDSEAGFSVNIRNKAVEMVRDGYTDDQIRTFFVERYGEWILRAPPMEGFNLILWVLPGAALLIGFWFVSIRTRRWAETESKRQADELEALTPDEEQRVEADLKRFRRT